MAAAEATVSSHRKRHERGLECSSSGTGWDNIIAAFDRWADHRWTGLIRVLGTPLGRHRDTINE